MMRIQKLFNKCYPFLKSAVSTVVLVQAVLRSKQPSLILALAFCICGDFLLAKSGELRRERLEPFFTAGIIAFGIAHIFLIWCFLSSGVHWTILLAAVFSCILPVGIRIGFIVPGRYRRRIILYSIVVSLMLASAICTSFFPAALLFWISDGLLSIWYFHPGTPFQLGGAALVIYYASLFLMNF